MVLQFETLHHHKKSLGIMLTIVLIGTPHLAGYFLFLYKTFHGKVKLDDTSY